ncbi:regenerating islet-derived protein 4-like, partial [Ascaphus truei]|uniref:regenerating islet-derived protein 4-like n=1 Tax=Ascaphus truei TaxID=8439 RepID=UPI003F5981B3
MASLLLALLLLSSVALTQAAPKARSMCPNGWFFYKANCYGYFRYPLSWAEAEYDCQAYGNGAHLASIQDASEADIIASHISAYQKTHPVWIGLHDPEQVRPRG